MLNSTNALTTFVRYYRSYPKRWLPDAVRYGFIKYHPRTKDHVDPPIVPTKVLMVHRVKPFKGNPWWEKDILENLGFEKGKKEPVFVKNTPEMCAILWKVKHLVKIVPVKVPDNLSEIKDTHEIFFHENGTCFVNGKVDPFRKEATEAEKRSIKRMDSYTISEKLRLQWTQGILI